MATEGIIDAEYIVSAEYWGLLFVSCFIILSMIFLKVCYTSVYVCELALSNSYAYILVYQLSNCSAFFVQFLSTWMVPSFIPVSFASGTVGSFTTQGKILVYVFLSFILFIIKQYQSNLIAQLFIMSRCIWLLLLLVKCWK